MRRPLNSNGPMKKNGNEIIRPEIKSVLPKIVSEKAHEPLVSIARSPKELSSMHAGLYKQALSVSNYTSPTTGFGSERLAPEIYSPLFQLANLNLPRDRITQNAWNRVFYDTHPIVRNAINLHASFPISKINITCKIKEVQEFFEEMCEEIDLYNVVYGAALEFWKMGEAFPFAELDEERGCWRRITILNPDYINVEKEPVGDKCIISLRPDAAFKKLVASNYPNDIILRNRISPHIIDYVKRGQNIPLDNFNISHLKLLSAPYDQRGISIIVSVYKDLMLYDRVRESKFAQADGMINPLTLVTMGSGSSPDYRPTKADLDAMKDTLESAQYDKDFKIITHDGVKIERVGFSGETLDVTSDMEMIINNIYVGLMTPKALIEQESSNYASSSIGLEVLRQRYDIFRNMMRKWLERKIFAPISEIQGFFEYVNNEKRLIVPKVDFNHMNLFDVGDYIEKLGSHVADKKISMHSLHRTLGLDYDEERALIRQEMIDEVIRVKEEAALGAMRLSDLRNMDPDKAITEPTNADAPPAGLPGMDSGEGGGMDLGGMGDMGGIAPPSPGGAPSMPETPPEAPITPPKG